MRGEPESLCQHNCQCTLSSTNLNAAIALRLQPLTHIRRSLFSLLLSLSGHSELSEVSKDQSLTRMRAGAVIPGLNHSLDIRDEGKSCMAYCQDAHNLRVALLICDKAAQFKKQASDSEPMWSLRQLAVPSALGVRLISLCIHGLVVMINGERFENESSQKGVRRKQTKVL